MIFPSRFKVVGNPIFQYIEVGQGEEFTIPAVDYSDAGQYKCIAFNAAGNAQSSEVSLSIYPQFYRFCPHCFARRNLPEGCLGNGLPYYFYAVCQRRHCRIPLAFLNEPDDVCLAPGVHRRHVCRPHNSFGAINVRKVILIILYIERQTFQVFMLKFPPVHVSSNGKGVS